MNDESRMLACMLAITNIGPEEAYKRLRPEGSPPASCSESRGAGRKPDAHDKITTPLRHSRTKEEVELKQLIEYHERKAGDYAHRADHSMNPDEDACLSQKSADHTEWASMLSALQSKPLTQSEAGWSGGGLIEKDRKLTEKLKSMIYPGGPESLIDRGKREKRIVGQTKEGVSLRRILESARSQAANLEGVSEDEDLTHSIEFREVAARMAAISAYYGGLIAEFLGEPLTQSEAEEDEQCPVCFSKSFRISEEIYHHCNDCETAWTLGVGESGAGLPNARLRGTRRSSTP